MDTSSKFQKRFLLKSNLNMFFIIIYFLVVVTFCTGEEINTDFSETSVVEENETHEQEAYEGEGTQVQADDDTQAQHQLHEEDIQNSIGVHYATSPLHLILLAQTEGQIYHALGDYEQLLLKRLDTIRRYRDDYDKSAIPISETVHPSVSDWERAKFLTSHPLYVYRMLQRYAIYLKEFYIDIFANIETDIWKKLEVLRGAYQWPNEDDFLGAVKTLFRLQHTYDLPAEEFANGNFNGIQTAVELTAQQCVEIAELALGEVDTITSSEWLKAARRKLTDGNDKSVSQDVLQTVWDKTVRLHGKTWNIDDFRISDVFYEAKTYVREAYEEYKFNLTHDWRIQNYKALCRGEIPNNRPRGHRPGYCYLETKKHPYFYINPQLVEFHQTEPPIIQIYDVFGQRMIQDTIQSAFQTILDSNEHRTYKEAAFNQQLKSVIPAWSNAQIPSFNLALEKVKNVVGLRTNDAKAGGHFRFGIQGYAVGGHLEPCFYCDEDLPEILEEYGKRVATVEFFLNNVDDGGQTVFTNLGLSIRPIRGSVLIYHNVAPFRNEEEHDERLLRGSCPVFIGQKWVITYFVHQFDGKECFNMTHF